MCNKAISVLGFCCGYVSEIRLKIQGHVRYFSVG